MIFRAQLARQVLSGRKTQTRRPIKPGETECRYKPGHSYAVQPGRGKPEEGRIVILDVQDERLGDLTFKDARAEGFRTRADFAAYWLSLHDRGWDAQTEHTDEQVMARFEERYADRRVWAITFEVERDPVRLLADRNMKADYVNNPYRALTDEPEAIDATTLDRYAKAARERNREVWQAERRELERSIARLEADAGVSVELGGELRFLRRRIELIDGKLRKRAA